MVGTFQMLSHYCDGSWWESTRALDSSISLIEVSVLVVILEGYCVALWAKTYFGKTWLCGRINETMSSKCFEVFCKESKGSANMAFSSRSCWHTACPRPSRSPQPDWVSNLVGQNKSMQFPCPVLSPLCQVGCWVRCSLCEVDICLMGTGLRPPGLHTAARWWRVWAVLQVQHGLCPTGGVGKWWVPPPSPCPCTGQCFQEPGLCSNLREGRKKT